LQKSFSEVVPICVEKGFEPPGYHTAIRALGILGTEEELSIDEPSALQLSTPLRCAFCDRKEDRKSRIACFKCARPMCNAHIGVNSEVVCWEVAK